MAMEIFENPQKVINDLQDFIKKTRNLIKKSRHDLASAYKMLKHVERVSGIHAPRKKRSDVGKKRKRYKKEKSHEKVS